MDNLRQVLKLLARRIRVLVNYLVVAKLKLKGCHVDWSSVIHHAAIIEPSGGSILIGARSSVDRGAILRGMGGRISIGSNCSINAYSFLSGSGGIEIKDYVMIASHVSIYASNHDFDDTSQPMGVQGLTKIGIVIERDVWIGTGARILDGVRIETGSIVAAGAVVTSSTEPYSINAGVPARKLASRTGISVGNP